MNRTLSYYENNANHLSQRYESANVDKIHSLLLNTFSHKAHLLEIGCGSGRDASFMHNHGYDVLAVDGSEKMIKMAETYHSDLKSKMQVMKIPDELLFDEASFDGIYSIATLMHLDKNMIDQTIGKVATILKTDGKFFFSVSIQRDDLDDQSKDEKGRHFTTMLEDEWIVCCEKYGLQLEHTEITSDGLDRDGIVWLTCIVEKIIE